MIVPWNRINPCAFEQLALEYAKSEFPRHNWMPTPRSGDGNRDAEAVSNDWVLNQVVEYQHWLEAKFHHKSGAPSRSQLDPTLVSGLIDPSVRAILFVTNGRIPNSYMIRADRAFARPPDRFVEFREGADLARWLSQNDTISFRYFGAATGKVLLDRPQLEISSIAILDINDYRRALYRPLSRLIVGREYLLHLILRNSEPMDLQLDLGTASPLLIPRVGGNNQMHVRNGTSSHCVRVKARQLGIFEELDIVLKGRGILATEVLRKRLTIREDPTLQLVFGAQAKVASEIKQLLRSLRKGSNAICCLFGKGGVGKTHVLDSLEFDLDLRTDFLRVTFSGQQAEDARLLCQLILFLHFGPFGLQLHALDHSLISSTQQVMFFGPKLLGRLMRAISDSAEARSLVEDLAQNRDIRPVGTSTVDPQPAGTSVVVVADDVHKLSGSTASVMSRLLKDHFDGEHNSMLLLSARREEFHDATLRETINDCSIYSVELSKPTSIEVSSNIEVLLGRDSPTGFLSALSSIPYTTLNIVNLLSDLRTREQRLTDPALRQALEQWTGAARIGKDKVVLGRLTQARSLFPLLDVVYSVKIGVPLDPLIAKFGSRAVNKAAGLDLIRLNSDQMAMPFHDLTYDTYSELRGNIHTHSVGTFVAKSLAKKTIQPDRALPVLLRCGPSFESAYLSVALNYRDSFIQVGRFGPALNVAKSIVSVLERRFANEIDNQKSLAEAWFVYADCLDHCSTGDESRIYFEKARGNLDYKWSSPNGNGVHFEAEAELFNIRFWDLEVDQFSHLKTFVTKLKQTLEEVPEMRQERRFVRAYLSALNRLMMFSLLLDKPASDLRRQNLHQSEQFGMENYFGFALVDYAKGTYHLNPTRALQELNEGNRIFDRLGSEHRRMLTSRTEIAFIEARLGLGRVNSLVHAGQSLLEDGLWPEYLNSCLKWAALLLVQGDVDGARSQLSEFYQRRSSASDDTRRIFLLANLEGAAAFLKGEQQAALDWTIEHQKVVTNLGASYRASARHNLAVCKELTNSRSVGWYQQGAKPPEGQFLLEPRIW